MDGFNEISDAKHGTEIVPLKLINLEIVGRRECAIVAAVKEGFTEKIVYSSSEIRMFNEEEQTVRTKNITAYRIAAFVFDTRRREGLRCGSPCPHSRTAIIGAPRAE